MADRILIKNGIVLTQDPSLGELPQADVLIEGSTIAAVGPNLSAEGARVIDADGDIVIPGFIDTHRHTWETSIRTCAPDFALITYFGSILDKFAPHYRPDDVYAGNLWGALECINAGITTLVDWSHIINTPDHADAGIRGSGGVEDPVGLRVRLRQHVPRRLVVRPGLPGQRADLGRPRRAADPEAVLQLRRRAHHHGARDPRPQLLQARRGPPRLGAGQGARAQHHGPRGDGPLRLHEDAGDRAARHGPAVPEHDLRARVALHRRGVGARARLGRQRLVRAPDRGPDGPRLGAGRHRARAQPADRPLVRRGHDRAVRPVHPDALDLRLRARPQAPGVVGRQPRRARGVARAHHLAPGPRVGDAGRGQGRGDRGPDRLDHARQEGRHRDHRRVGRERRPDHRPGRCRRLRGRRLQREDGARRRRDPEGGLQAGGVADRAAQGRRGVARLPDRASSAIRSRAGCRPRPTA